VGPYAHSNRRRRARGVVLLDVLLGVFTVTLMAAGIFSLLPSVHKSQDLAVEQARATQLANRMLEHLQLLTPDTLNGETLLKLNLIDSYGGGKYVFTNVPLDAGARYSPATALPQGTGSFTMTDIEAGSVRIDLEIAWKSGSGKSQKISTGTIVGGHR